MITSRKTRLIIVMVTAVLIVAIIVGAAFAVPYFRNYFEEPIAAKRFLDHPDSIVICYKNDDGDMTTQTLSSEQLEAVYAAFEELLSHFTSISANTADCLDGFSQKQKVQFHYDQRRTGELYVHAPTAVAPEFPTSYRPDLFHSYVFSGTFDSVTLISTGYGLQAIGCLNGEYFGSDQIMMFDDYSAINSFWAVVHSFIP